MPLSVSKTNHILLRKIYTKPNPLNNNSSPQHGSHRYEIKCLCLVLWVKLLSNFFKKNNVPKLISQYVCAAAPCCTEAGELGCFHRGRSMVTHLPTVLLKASVYWLHLRVRAMKVVKSSPSLELGIRIPVKICPFLSSVSRKCHMERVCKYVVHHNPPGWFFHELHVSKYLGDSQQCCVSIENH